jgi:hypothetical protein
VGPKDYMYGDLTPPPSLLQAIVTQGYAIHLPHAFFWVLSPLGFPPPLPLSPPSLLFGWRGERGETGVTPPHAGWQRTQKILVFVIATF